MVFVSNENEDKDVQLSLKLFIVLTRTLESIQTQVVKDIKSHGLNKTEFGVLELLYSKGDHPIQQIGQKLLLASSSITYVVDKLETKKLIERRACPRDRRVTYATITDDGKELMNQVFPKHKKALNEILSGLDMNEKKILIKQLKKLGFHAQNI